MKKKMKIVFWQKTLSLRQYQLKNKNKSTFFNFEDFKNLFEKKIGNGFLVKNSIQSQILEKGLKFNQPFSTLKLLKI